MRAGKMRVLGAVIGLGLWACVATAQELPKADAVFREIDSKQVLLGQLLFYDPILSGNKTVSCATCHHPKFATADGVALGLGDGGIGLGPDRVADPENLPEQRIPRNAPALFNLGAVEFTTFFHDGRLEVDASRPGGIRTPLGAEMEQGFASVLSAQTMFPVLSADEMAGHYSENDVSQAVRQGLITGPGGAWDILAGRVAAIPEYKARFAEIMGDEPIHFTDISDAIAQFVEFEWRGDNSPFDQFLRLGTPLTAEAQAGMELFYGKAACATCHSGQFQTDHEFHAIAMPQIGPGKAARFERHARDLGRQRVTGDPADAYAFRTPSLRNVARTGPYGHAGAYATLEDAIRHHLDPVTSLTGFDGADVVLAELPVDDLRVVSDAAEVAAIAGANVLAAQDLSDGEVQALVAFLHALTDEASIRGALGVPETVPSGLPIDR